MKRIVQVVVSFVFVVGFSQEICGQAYCALRDPVARIYESFPKADSFRSIVRTVNQETRQRVYEELPFTLHFNELGRHTLYVATEGRRPLGVVHVRSESGSWGLVEIVWALSNDLKLIDYSFQRCRSRSRKAVETEAFKQQLIGKGFDELRAMLAEDGKRLRPDQLQIDAANEALAFTLVRSALKTMLVTRHGWSQDLEVLRLLEQAYDTFPNGGQVEMYRHIYGDAATASLEDYMGGHYQSAVDPNTALALRVLDDHDHVLGTLVYTHWKGTGFTTNLWWELDPNLAIRSVKPAVSWPSAEVERSFEQVRGLNLNTVGECSTTVESLGAEILVVIQALEDDR